MFKVCFALLRLSVSAIACLLVCSTAKSSLAQVTTDSTVNTRVESKGNISEITGGATRDDNLFHSFQDFSVPQGNEAFFNNAADIANIFSRVTGGNISELNGLIRANGSANLFLINPAGIVFGESAQLDLGGSFYGSTADSILFEDGEFGATDLDNPPLLTVNAPIGLNFRDRPAEIVYSSTADSQDLQVAAEQELNLLGGNINLSGVKLTAPAGKINLGGLSEAGIVAIAADGNFSFADDVARADVSLGEGTIVDVGGGTINVNADNFELTGNSQLRAAIEEGLGSDTAIAGTVQIDATRIAAEDNSAIVVSTFGRGDAGTVEIDARDVAFAGEWGGIYSNVGLPRVATESQIADAEGNGGEISITADSIELTKAARISANSVARGNAGQIEIEAKEEVTFGGVGSTPVPAFDGGSVISGASSQVQFAGVGDAGRVSIDAGALVLETGALFANHTGLRGNAGEIDLDLDDNISLDRGAFLDVQVGADTTADAGSITIKAGSYESQGGSRIFADNLGVGNGGNVELTVANTVALSDDSTIQTKLGDRAVGNAGGIAIAANALILNSNSVISAQTEGKGDAGAISIDAAEVISLTDSQISGQVFVSATGNGADISLTGGELNLDNSRIITNNDARSANPENISTAGDINLDIAGDLNLSNGSQIQSQVGIDALGNAGNITIDTAGSFLATKGDRATNNQQNQILANSNGEGDGGNIQISAAESIAIDDESLILANTRSRGSAGTLSFEAGATFALSESLILSQVEDRATGDAGGINITATTIKINDFSLVSTNAQAGTSGKAGSIDLNGNQIEISNGAVVDALTENAANGGNIDIGGGSLAVVSGGTVVTSATGAGDAGNINLRLTGDVMIDGAETISRPESVFELSEQASRELQESTGLFATSSSSSTGRGGNIKIANSGEIAISNNGTVSVDSQGQNDGGNLAIATNALILDNQAVISALTASGDGGNIDLIVSKKISLDNNSNISARAFNAANGGNIDIDTDFVVAFPNRDSDIVANAQMGQGGNIQIAAESILGIAERNSNLANTTNDIDASSEFGLDGTVSIFAPDTNTFESAAELPSNIIKSEQTVSQACNSNGSPTSQNNLALNGKGGISPPPDAPLDSQTLSLAGESKYSSSAIPAPIATSQGKIQLARGITVNRDGSLSLTANSNHRAVDRLTGAYRNCG